MMMKRSRPRRHVRKLSSGRKVLVNKGVMKNRNYGSLFFPDKGTLSKVASADNDHDLYTKGIINPEYNAFRDAGLMARKEFNNPLIYETTRNYLRGER